MSENRSERPDKVKIGAYDYAIEWVDQAWTDETNLTGAIVYNRKIIKLRGDLRDIDTADVFIHEVTHGIVDHFSRASDEPVGREDISEWMGAGLTMVLRDNPDVTRWLFSLLT